MVSVIAFWKKNEKNGYLSQWYPSKFTYKEEFLCHDDLIKFDFLKNVEGFEFVSAEHFMMISKSLVFKDDNIFEQMKTTTSTYYLKMLGRKVKNFNDTIWRNMAMDILRIGNYLKFKQNKKLCDMLLSTNDSILAEASPYDKIYGIGIIKNVDDLSKWQGENKLGYVLMDVRKMINK